MITEGFRKGRELDNKAEQRKTGKINEVQTLYT